MNSSEKFITSLVLIVVVAFALLFNYEANKGIRFVECKQELAKQTKLDTPNIVDICSEVYGK